MVLNTSQNQSIQKNIFAETYSTVLGPLTFVSQKDSLLHIMFGDFEESCKKLLESKLLNGPFEHKESPVIVQAYTQVDEYLKGKRKLFNIPLAPNGTPFQLKVWQALLTIPYGEVWSYKQLAKKVDNPKAFRAVGQANNRNPLPIIIPCHRVIGQNGTLVGYAGGLKIKLQLLDIERNND